MTKPREPWTSETLGLIVFVLLIVFLASGYGAFALTAWLWLRFDPKVLVLLRPPTPEEAHHEHLFAITVLTAAISTGVFACWLVCRAFDRPGRQRSLR